MNIESSNLYNILSAIIINQSLLKSQLSNANKEIFYKENFDVDPDISGLYINKKGETGFWNGKDWEYISQEVISGITMQSTHETIPTSKAVYDLVDSRTSGSVSDGVITDINLSINSISENLGVVSSKLTEVIDDVEDLKENSGKAELFYVNNFDIYPEGNPPPISGLYIDHDGETRFWNGTEWEYTSKNVVSIIDNSTINLDVETVPTAKAVHDFVKNQIENIEFPEDEKPEVFYVESFPSKPEISGFYIDYNGKTGFWDGSNWEQTSYELLNEINSTDENKVPSVKAVYDYVNNITSDFISTSSLNQFNLSISNISNDLTDVSGNVNQLSDNIRIISDDVDELKRNISSNEGKPEVFYIETFNIYTEDNPPPVSGLYIDHEGETRFWNGDDWEKTSYEIIDEVIENEENKVPTSKAIYDFVKAEIEKTDVSNDSGKPEVFYIETFDIYTKENEPAVSGLYIDYNGQSKFWNGDDWEQTSIEIIDEIKLNDNNELIDKEKITSVKAVYDFVKSEIENIEIPEGGKPEVFYISSFVNYTPTGSGLYIDHDGETRFWNGDDWEQTSHEVIDEITDDIEKKEDKIPSVKAVYNYVNEKTSGTSSGGGKDEIFYVPSFPEDDETPAAGLYIVETGESRYYTGEKWETTSYEVIDEVLPNEENKVPTSKAIYDFVNNKVGEGGGNNTSDGGKPEVFYVKSFPSNPEISGFYIDYDGETKFWDGSNWEQTSHEIVDEIDELSIAKITVPTSNAVCKFVKDELSKFEFTGEGGPGKPEVFYVESFVSKPEVSGLYINHKGESSFYTGSEWKKITVETINEVNSSENTKIPTSKAIYDFVKSEIENIEIPEVGKPEVFYVPTFDNFTPEISGLYIDHDGETRFWNETNWESISHEIATEISNETSENIAVSVKAVRNFVQSEINKIEFTGGTNTGSGKPEVFYVPTFDNFTPEISGLYIDHDGETRFWNNTEWEYTSKEVIDDITENGIELISGYLPSVGAVYNFINDKLENIQNTGSEKDEIFHIESFINYIPDVVGLYIDNEGQSRYWNGDDWDIVSREIVNNITSSSLSSTIPSTKAVYDFVNSKIGNGNSSNGSNITEIFYEESFSDNPSTSGLYINYEGETRFWTGSEWKLVSRSISELITDESTDNEVPTSKAVYNLVNSNAGIHFIYFDVPDESQIDTENENRLLIEIDFSNDDNFSTKESFTLSSCQVFNPATGNWITCPSDGLDIAVANSKIRINKPEINYLNCRYRWKTTNSDFGSYKTAII